MSVTAIQQLRTALSFVGRLRGPEDAITLYNELQSLLADLALGSRSVDDVRSWLEDHVDDVLESGDARVIELDGLAWTLIGELDRGDRDEQSVRTELGAVATLR